MSSLVEAPGLSPARPGDVRKGFSLGDQG